MIPAGLIRRAFIASSTGRRLSSFHLPGDGPGLLLVGGYGGSPLEKPFGLFAVLYCLENRLDLRLLEFRGQGGSEGQLADLTIPEMRDDVLALADRFSLSGRIGIGSSLGAWAMLAAQQDRPDLLWGMVALAPAVDWDLSYLLPRIDDGRARRDQGMITVQEDLVAVAEAFCPRAADARLRSGAAGPRLAGPIGILHGDADRIAPLSRSEQLRDDLRAAGNRVELRLLPGFAHNVAVLQGKLLQDACREACDGLLQEWRSIFAPGSSTQRPGPAAA